MEEEIVQGWICPYCGNPSEHVDSEEIYGTSYGMIYLCRPCDAYVGTHKDEPIKSLGRLANKELREAKKEAHFYFDQLWKRKMIEEGVSKKEARSGAYAWLSRVTGIPSHLCHIGMFHEKLCYLVVDLCKPYAIKHKK